MIPSVIVARPDDLTHTAGMRRSTAINALKPCEASLRARGVTALFLFGSTARDEAGDASDVDLLFEHDPRSRFSLFTQATVADELSERLGTKVDLIALDGLKAPFRQRVSREMVQVF